MSVALAAAGAASALVVFIVVYAWIEGVPPWALWYLLKRQPPGDE